MHTLTLFYKPVRLDKVALSLFPLFLSCISAPAYLSDRGMDARDIVDASFQTASIGFALEIGPYLISPLYIDYYGLGLSGGEMGYNGKPSFGGLLIASNMNTESGSKILNTRARLDYRQKEFNSVLIIDPEFTTYDEKLKPKIQSFGRVGIRVGAVAGIRLAFNFIEAMDFVTGIFGFDILEDDYYLFLKKQEAGSYASKK